MNMKKKILSRFLLGFPIGISIGYLLSIVTSVIWARGYYQACVPDLIAVMGSEINAVILQAVLCGLLGAGFSSCSVIWEIEHWSIVQQTGLYFLLVSIIMMPIAYVTYWMEHSIRGFFSYFGIFILIFVVIWISQFFIGMQNVKKMNANLNKTKREEDTQ